MDKSDGVGGKQSDKRVQLKPNNTNIIKYISNDSVYKVLRDSTSKNRQ